MGRGGAILMYHAIGRPGEPASRFVVPLRRFCRQMRALELLRYRVVPLDQISRAPARAVALTFDDGYADNRLAFAELEQRRFPATVFVVTGSAYNDWDDGPPLGGRPLLGLDELPELDSSVTVGAHTRTHPRLTSVAGEAAGEEVIGSLRDLEDVLGRPATSFAYPYGAYDERVCALVADAGFAYACTVAPGRNTASVPPLELRRLEIEGTFSLPRFLLTLWLGDTRFVKRWRARRALRRHPPERGVP